MPLPPSCPFPRVPFFSFGKFAGRLAGAAALYVACAFAAPFLESSLYLARLAAGPAPGHLRVPVASVPAHAIRDTWHADRDGGRRRHEGIDIFARKGTPVRATTEGIVIRVGQNRLGGKVVWVMGPGRQRHYYAHLDAFAPVHAGERIQPGALLGFVGNTGNARTTPPHLHYGIYAMGGALNPYPLLKAGPGRPAETQPSRRPR